MTWKLSRTVLKPSRSGDVPAQAAPPFFCPPCGLLKHPREDPKPDDQASGVDDDCEVDTVPMRILAFFVALCRFIHWSSPFREVRPKLQNPTPIQQSNTMDSASFCVSEKSSRLRTERMIAATIQARMINK